VAPILQPGGWRLAGAHPAHVPARARTYPPPLSLTPCCSRPRAFYSPAASKPRPRSRLEPKGKTDADVALEALVGHEIYVYGTGTAREMRQDGVLRKVQAEAWGRHRAAQSDGGGDAEC
jgi:hypothetical protein